MNRMTNKHTPNSAYAQSGFTFGELPLVGSEVGER